MDLMDYISQNHSKHLLMVHLIFSCKYRKKLLIKYGEEIKKIFWGDGYFACSIGQVSKETIEKYIQNQG